MYLVLDVAVRSLYYYYIFHPILISLTVLDNFVEIMLGGGNFLMLSKILGKIQDVTMYPIRVFLTVLDVFQEMILRVKKPFLELYRELQLLMRLYSSNV